MVLQRDAPLRITGTADRNERLVIQIGHDQQAAVADTNGNWTVLLPKMQAGGPFTLTVRGKTTVSLHDILIGELWVASGQSNMTYGLDRSQGGVEAVQNADRPYIRLLKVPQTSSLRPTHRLTAAWALCTPATARDFSAVAYYFAVALHAKLHVPIGIVESAWPGTQAESWTRYGSLENNPELQPIVNRWLAEPADVKQFAAEGSDFALGFDSFDLLAKQGSTTVAFANFDNRTANIDPGGLWESQPPRALALVSPGQGGSAYAMQFSGNVSLEHTPLLRATIHGLQDGVPAMYNLSAYAGLRFQVRGHGCFRLHLEEPSTVDGDFYSSGQRCATKDWQSVTLLFKYLKQAGWGVVHPLTLRHISAISIDAAALHGSAMPPANVYNAMIVPLTDYTIRGALWYQGEGNAGRAVQYETLLPAMIADWRKDWREGDFPFFIVQLPGFGKPSLNAEEAAWAEMREAQALIAETVPHAALTVTLDLGEPGNLHPPRKAEVGERLALLAFNKTYGHNVEYSGPLLVAAQRQDASFLLQFSHAEALKARDGGTVEGFAVAGEDKRFFPASATVDGTTIRVTSPSVSHPVAVRYAWAASPICNLVNGARLPAAPFRTDHWPETTQEAR